MRILLCEDSIDGIFSGIYRAYECNLGHNQVQLRTAVTDTFELFCDYEDVPVNYERSKKVADTLVRRLGLAAYQDLCEAISARETDADRKKEIPKAEAVYKTVVLALSMKDGHKILNHLGNPYVNRVFQLCRATSMEAHHLLGFLRFMELKNGVLFARMHPKHYVLPLLAEHFSDRLANENFIIYDESRFLAALHKKGAGYILTDVPGQNLDVQGYFSKEEQAFQNLWVTFFESISIKERDNPKLQSQNLPKRFWADTVELSSKVL